MKDFYFKLNGTVITDAIDYPYEGYAKATLTENQLPAGINAGYYNLVSGAYVRDEALYTAHVSTQVAKGKEEGREEIRAIVRGAALLNTIGAEAKAELKNKGVLPATA